MARGLADVVLRLDAKPLRLDKPLYMANGGSVDVGFSMQDLQAYESELVLDEVTGEMVTRNELARRRAARAEAANKTPLYASRPESFESAPREAPRTTYAGALKPEAPNPVGEIGDAVHTSNRDFLIRQLNNAQTAEEQQQILRNYQTAPVRTAVQRANEPQQQGLLGKIGNLAGDALDVGVGMVPHVGPAVNVLTGLLGTSPSEVASTGAQAALAPLPDYGRDALVDLASKGLTLTGQPGFEKAFQDQFGTTTGGAFASLALPETYGELALMGGLGAGAGIKAGATGGLRAGLNAAGRQIASDLLMIPDTALVPPGAVTPPIAEPVRLGDSMLARTPTQADPISLVRGAGDAADEAGKLGDEVVAAADDAIPPTGTTNAVADAAEDPGFAGNIRLEKFDENVRPIIQQTVDDNPELVEAARRGVIPDEQVQDMARQLVNDVGGDWDKFLRKWKPGEALNAEEIIAVRSSLDNTARKVLDAAEQVRLVDSTENQARLVQAIADELAVQQIVHGGSAEWGRAGRALQQQIKDLAASGDVRAMQQLLRQAVKANKFEDITDLADAIRALDLSNPTAVHDFLRSVNKPDFWDKLYYYWMNSILSGWVTQGRNIAGNAAATAFLPVNRAAAGIVDQPLALMGGRQADRFWQEAPAAVVGAFQGVPEGVRAALAMMKTGISPRQAAKFDLTHVAPIGGKAGRIIGAPTTALGMMDEFFSAVNYRAALNADAVRMARRERLSGNALTNRIAELLRDPPPNLMKGATEEAERLVFRDDPGRIARGLAAARNSNRAFRYVIPFLNTPANLLKYGIQYSPVGLLDAGAWQRAIKGNPQAVDQIARTFIGTSIAATVASLKGAGVIDLTAAVPTDAAERDRFFRAGKMPFSIKIPGLGWIEYKQMPALDVSLTLVATAFDVIERDGDPTEAITQAAANIGTNLLDKSYMSGISDLMDAIQNGGEAVTRYGTRQVSGFTPFSGFSRQTAQALDTTVRRPANLWETIKAQTPGLSQSVPPRLTAFGEESDRGFPSPVKFSPDRQSAVDAELERLGVEIGFTGDSIGGQGLSREEEAIYQQVAGQQTQKNLERLFANPRYQALSDVDKEKQINRARDAARDLVRDTINRTMQSPTVRAASPEDQKRTWDKLWERFASGWLPND